MDLNQEACDQRLRAALTEVTEHPEHWDQGVWVIDGTPDERDEFGWPCDTVACLAGVGAVQARLCMIVKDNGIVIWLLSDRGQEVLEDNPAYQRNWNSPEIDFGGLGALLFGLMQWQAAQLFHGDNTLADLWRLAAEFTAGRVTLPPELASQIPDVTRGPDA